MARPRKKKPAQRKTAASTLEKLRRLGEEALALRREADEAEAELAQFREQRQPAFERWLEAEFAAEDQQIAALANEIIEEELVYLRLSRLRSCGRDTTDQLADEIRESVRAELANLKAGLLEDEDEDDFDDFDEDDFDEDAPSAGATDSDCPTGEAVSSALAATNGRTGGEAAEEDAFFNELFESMPRELFERLFEDQFEAFFYDTRGLDPNEADPAEVSRARSEFRSAFAKLFGGDEEAGYEHLMRSAADLSPHRLGELKSLYRSLVRSLHPDRAETFGPEEKRLWEEVQAAHRSLDLEGLRELEVTLHLVRGEPVPPSKAPVLRAMYSRLRERLAMLREDLEEARETPAWRFDEQGDLKALAAEVASYYKELAARNAAELKSLKEVINALIEPFRPLRRPKRKARSGAAKKPAARREPPDPDAPVQLEFPF